MTIEPQTMAPMLFPLGINELVADAVHLVGDLASFDGVYILENQTVFRAAIVLRSEMDCTRAAARLTVLAHGGAFLLTLDVPRFPHRGKITPSKSDVALAAERARTRRSWMDESVAPRRMVWVSQRPEEVKPMAGVFRTPMAVDATSDVTKATELLVGTTPCVLVLDHDLPGIERLEEYIRALYPSLFRYQRLQWYSSRRGLRSIDIERIVAASDPPPESPRRNLFVDSDFHFLVVDTGEDLALEVHDAMPSARVERASGWDAIDRLYAGEYEGLILGECGDVSQRTFARVAATTRQPPLVILASALSRPVDSRDIRRAFR